MISNDTIIALATPSGSGAIAVIRISGIQAIAVAAASFRPVGRKDVTAQKTHTIHLGHIVDGQRVLDEVLLSLFRGPNSYTGENVVEISCHGSSYIQQQIIQLFLRKGCRMASPGEFTLRAFLNGKLDLSQAEAVADLIASDNEASHKIAMRQMRGGFSDEIKNLREELLNFASLIELELDFAEEDVEFADRTQFKALVVRIQEVLKRLIDSFAMGNVIKNGIPVAIVGEPNVGKSTLLNALLNEERALVSEIAGTTRDTIEDQLSIGGIGFRFIDTAGIRDTEDVVEGMGIKRTFEKIGQSQVILYMIDTSTLPDQSSSGSPSPPMSSETSHISSSMGEFSRFFSEIRKIRNKYPQKPLIIVANKIDQIDREAKSRLHVALGAHLPDGQAGQGTGIQIISAKTGEGIEELQSKLLEFVNTGALHKNETIVTNTRHYHALLKALESIQRVQLGMVEGLPSDLMAIDVREALYHLGEITGQVTNDELLGNIFANFCIGK